MGEGSALPRAGDTINEKYRIERVLGTGGMSTVFEATHCVTGRRFALKWLRPDMAALADVVRRFVREAKVGGRFKHPNVVEVYDFGKAGGSFYIVMELLEGESLEQRLERVGRFRPQEARRILVPAMRGVARAHAAGVIHRDIKPANIFLCKPTDERPEQIKVLDFGISRVATPDVPSNSPVTETGVWMGTPQYMSPEQVRGKVVDHRTDIYAFGVVLYELLTGEAAFDAITTSDLMVKVATEDPRPLSELVPDIDPALADLVMRAMARNPGARFPDLESMIRALQACAQVPLPPRASVDPAPSLPARTSQPHGKRVGLLLGTAAMFAVLVVLGLRVLEREDTRASSATQPREVASAPVPASPTPRTAAEDAAAASDHGPAHVIGKNAQAATDAAADRATTAQRAQDSMRRPRNKPRKQPLQPTVESEPAPAARSGVTFDLEDFLPGETAAQARERAPASTRSGTHRDPSAVPDAL